MLHELDGYDERWEAEIENTHNDAEEQICLNRIRRRVVRALENNDDNSRVGNMIDDINNVGFANATDNVAVEISTEHEIFRIN
jgi:hypothetical protein